MYNGHCNVDYNLHTVPVYVDYSWILECLILAELADRTGRKKVAWIAFSEKIIQGAQNGSAAGRPRAESLTSLI